MALLGLVSLGVLAYIYLGYPALLRLLVRVRGIRRVRRDDITPSVSLVISAFNEADVIRKKLENALALSYPSGALDVIVVSDASSDGTDAIVAEYAARGVTLVRQPDRRGKTAGLNRAVPTLRGDIVVFSDANAIYQPDAVQMLVRNFADPAVGCVTGEARYVARGPTVADVTERAYWDYEIQIKRYETAVGSMVGGDGAIYAIRRSLWQELPEDAINDFLNPLQIVARGWRAVYEPDAVCFEETAGGIGREYRRRVRIVSRSWRAVFQAKAVLNPMRVGLFTWSLVSHKILRWVSGVFLALAVVGAGSVLWDAFVRWPIATTGFTAAGLVAAATPAGRPLVGMLVYFIAISTASCVGAFKGSIGRVSGVWAPPRERTDASRPARALVSMRAVFLVSAASVLGCCAAVYLLAPVERFAAALFWGAAGALVYIYAGYPAILAILRRIAGKPVRRGRYEPRVAVLVAANDEDAVIDAKMQNTLALDYPADRLEIVVASDGSVDRTDEIVRSYWPRVRLVGLSPRRGKMAAIIEAIATIQADVVVFSDANTFLESDAVRALVRNFVDPQVGAVSGDVALIGARALLGRSEDLYYRYERWVQRAESEIGSMIGADGALYAIRRELFVAPPPDTILDDMAIPMAVVRAGRRVVYDGDARAHEEGSETARDEFARKARVIAGAMQFIARRESAVPASDLQVMLSFMSHKALRWLSPVFALCAFVSSVSLVGTSLTYTSAAAAQVTILALGLAGCAPVLRRVNVVALAHYFCLVQAAAAVGFVRGLTGRQSVMWQRFDRVQSRVGVQQ